MAILQAIFTDYFKVISLFSAMVLCSFPDSDLRVRFLHIHVDSLKKDCPDTAAKSYSGSAI